MKKIIAAGIVRVLKFDRKDEADIYLYYLDHKKIRYKINFQEQLNDGRVILNITTAYNSSSLIKRIKEIAEEEEE